MPQPSNQPRKQRSLAGFDVESADLAAKDPPSDLPRGPAQADFPASEPRPGHSQQDGSPQSGAQPESLADSVVYVIDSYSLIYQVFHAMGEMTGPSGQSVGATHGFTRDMLDLIERHEPDYLICAFDLPGPTFRHRLYQPYKEHRQEMPIDLRPQIGDIRRMLEAMGIASIDCEGFEADDILATLARRVEEMGGRAVLVSGDKDCRQLITQSVRIYNIRKDMMYDAQELQDDWGIRPDQVVDFQSLVGDSVDNIPGVPLIGPKIAGQLLAQYGTLEEVLDHAEEVSGKKRRENLINFREQALLSRQLVRLDNQTPIEIDWNAARVGGVNQEQVEQLCREFGFRRLGERLANQTVKAPQVEWKADYQSVTSVDHLRQLVDEMSRQDRISIDTETTSINPRWAEIVGYSFAWKPGEAYYVPVAAPAGDPQIDPQEALEAMRGVLENRDIKKIGQNLKYDIVTLRTAGIQMQGAAMDTMVADYLLDPGQRNHSLDDLAKRYLDHDTIKISELIGVGKKQIRMDEVPLKQITEYAAEDADVPLRLADILERRLAEEGLDELFNTLEMPLIQTLAEMEYNGIRVDTELLGRLSQRYAKRLAELEIEIYELAGHEFNIDSRLQLSAVLFDELGLPIIKKTKTGASTDVEVLTELAKRHPLPAKIIEYRQNAKLKSTYVDALPQLVHPKTLRVHTSFKQDVAATGRLSSKDPNLQNIPVRNNAGREIRSAFLPGPPGWKLLTADYSQIELRVLAHFSEDPALHRAFAENQDIHALVASEVYGVRQEEVTPDMRRHAKAINFGVIYGQSAFGLAKALDIEKDQAAEFIESYFTRYSGVGAFMDRVLDDCHEKGYVSTISGRRRAVQGVRDAAARGDSRQRTPAERIAVNTVIQGSAADLIKRAMIDVHRRLLAESMQAKMLLQIHDELLFEAPSDELTDLARLVDEEMTNAGDLSVALKVDIKIGANWAECEPLE